MQNDHTGAIRGMAIANIIITGLSLILLISCSAMLAANIGPLMDLVDEYADSGYIDDYLDDGNGSIFDNASLDAASVDVTLTAAGHSHSDGGLISSDPFSNESADYTDLVSDIIVGVIAVVAVIWGLMLALTLLAAIFILVYCGKPEKLQAQVIWSIVGAVISFLSCSIVVTILFIISAVFASGDKKAYQMSQPQTAQPQMPQPPYNATPNNTYTQGIPTSIPTTPAANPVATVAPVTEENINVPNTSDLEQPIQQAPAPVENEASAPSDNAPNEAPSDKND